MTQVDEGCSLAKTCQLGRLRGLRADRFLSNFNPRQPESPGLETVFGTYLVQLFIVEQVSKVRFFWSFSLRMFLIVPLRWLAINFCAFDKLFHNTNSMRSYRDPTEIASSAVFCQHEAKSEPFRIRFAYFSRSIERIQYKTREIRIGRQIAVNLGTCRHFYVLTLKDKAVKLCHSTIFKVFGGWGLGCQCFTTLFVIFVAKKVSKITILAN